MVNYGTSNVLVLLSKTYHMHLFFTVDEFPLFPAFLFTDSVAPDVEAPLLVEADTSIPMR